MSHAKLKEKEKSLRKEIVQNYVSKASAGCSMNTYPMSAESVDEIWILDKLMARPSDIHDASRMRNMLSRGPCEKLTNY
jgi:hypothetical protein